MTTCDQSWIESDSYLTVIVRHLAGSVLRLGAHAAEFTSAPFVPGDTRLRYSHSVPVGGYDMEALALDVEQDPAEHRQLRVGGLTAKRTVSSAAASSGAARVQVIVPGR